MSNKQPLTFHQFRTNRQSIQSYSLDRCVPQHYYVVGHLHHIGYILELAPDRWCLSIYGGDSLISNDLLDLEFKLWQWYVKKWTLEMDS